MSQKHYPEVNPSPDFPALEQEMLKAWKNNKTFEKSVETRPALRADGKNNEFIFYDGPPFANGLPHYGHLLTGFVKDVFARYQTMQGKKVERRFGWDCHGLPAEMGSEKELKISGRAAIQNYGIDKFNEHCRENVMKYASEWEDYVTRQARWVDFKNDYKTMDINFMESVLWAFKQLYDKGLVYEAHRVMPYSWAAETPLSNFETKLDNSYREREDKAITVAFELTEESQRKLKDKLCLKDSSLKKIYILAWTTTPWTLPSNLALAVSSNIEYRIIGDIKGINDGVAYICAASRINQLSKELGFADFDANEFNRDKKHDFLVDIISGNDLVGLSYHPLFPYFEELKIDERKIEIIDADEMRNVTIPQIFKIISGDFVSDSDGTGIVHIAPGFGEDDQRVASENAIPTLVPVDGQGKYTDAIFDLPDLSLKGLNVIAQTEGQQADEPYKPEQVKKYGLVNLRIINWLKNNGKLIKQEEIKHNYPHCWRTDQPLIYRAMPSWYVEVTKFRDRAAELNQQINWIPEHIKDGQMGHMLKTAPDWSISRNRFWGTPIPVWRSKSGNIIVCGSIAEIEQLSGKKVKDLHRPYIDEITIEKDGEIYTRVEDVFDCWFESGSMPFAQVHYPFENKDWFEKHFPADFITEYVGQTRGWFNTLIMLSTALFDKVPFRNCICHGVVLDAETGLKYSKRLKNYKDPMEVINQFGADALRWLMIASPVMRGQDLMVDPEGKFIRDVVRLAIKPIWNAYNFFTLYANADGVRASSCGTRSVSAGSQQEEKYPALSLRSSQDDMNIMDSYILAKCNHAVADIEKALNAYDTPSACEAVLQFFDVLNNWYIRRNKERFWKSEHDADKQAAYDTLYTVLSTMCRAAAPLLPLTCEEIYKNLTGEESVHLATFPSLRGIAEAIQTGSPRSDAARDDELIANMDWARDVCNTALSIRNKVNIRVRQPLKSLEIAGYNKVRTVEIVPGSGIHGNLTGIISDEVNVKLVYTVHSFEDYATLKLSINSAILGKRLPTLMKQILPASKKGEWKQLGDGSVEICGEKLLPSEYVLQLEPKPEYKDMAQALSTNDGLVILDIYPDENLIAEGIARDVVRMIQQARKDANLNVSDKIKLYLEADAKSMAAISANQNYIMEQTLTDELLKAKQDKPFYTTENELDDNKIIISLSVVN